MTYLLLLLDPGPNFRKEYSQGVSDVRAFLEVFRRLQLPYYEEARIYWNQAMRDGFFQSGNEVWTYLPSTLEMLIQEYGE